MEVRLMDPFGIIAGISTYYILKGLKKSGKRLAVMATSQALNIADKSREKVYNAKEEMEDIIAEAHYEHIKRKQQDKKMNDDDMYNIMNMQEEEGGESS